MHLAVLLLGATALFSRIIPLSATDITLGRSLVACALLVGLLGVKGQSLRLYSMRDYGLALLLGVIMAAHWVTYFAAMQYSSVSVGMIALFTFPVLTVLLEPLFERVRLAWQDLVSALVVLLGIALIVPEPSLDNDVTLGIVIGVVSALLYAVRNLLHRNYFSQYSGTQAMAYQTLVIVLCLLGFGSDALYNADWHTLGLLILLGSVCTALPHVLIANSFKHLRAKSFALIACAQPLYGTVLAAWLLHESPGVNTLIGGTLVICAALYETVNTHRAQR